MSRTVHDFTCKAWWKSCVTIHCNGSDPSTPHLSIMLSTLSMSHVKVERGDSLGLIAGYFFAMSLYCPFTCSTWETWNKAEPHHKIPHNSFLSARFRFHYCCQFSLGPYHRNTQPFLAPDYRTDLFWSMIEKDLCALKQISFVSRHHTTRGIGHTTARGSHFIA